MPLALAAVISEWRVNAPTAKTVANSTAAGSTRNIVSGTPYRYASPMVCGDRWRLRYLSSFSVRSMTMTSSGKPSAVATKILVHSTRT